MGTLSISDSVLSEEERKGKSLWRTPNHMALEPRMQTTCVAWTKQWEAIICDNVYMKETTRCLEVKVRITDIRNSAGKTEDCPFKGELENRNLDLKKISQSAVQREWATKTLKSWQSENFYLSVPLMIINCY